MKIEKFAKFNTLFERMGISYDEYRYIIRKIQTLTRGKTFSIKKKNYTIWAADKKRSGCRECDLSTYWKIAMKESEKICSTENIGCPFFAACASAYRIDKTSVSFVDTTL